MRNLGISAGSTYVFSCYVKSTSAGSITICGKEISSTSTWTRSYVRFTAESTQLELNFEAGEYWIYKAKLEAGTVPTDWTQSPSDIKEEAIAEGLGEWCYNNDITFIDGGKIYTGTVTAKQINVTDLFAQDITASGTISGVTITGASGTFTKSFNVSCPWDNDASWTLGADSSGLKFALEPTGDSDPELGKYAVEQCMTLGQYTLTAKNIDIKYTGAMSLKYNDINVISVDGEIITLNDMSLSQATFVGETHFTGNNICYTAFYGTQQTSIGTGLKAILGGVTDSSSTYFGNDSGNDGITSYLRGNNVRLYAHSGGGVYLGASGSTAITSDENLKDLYDMDSRYEDFFNNLNPLAYQYKDTGNRSFHRKHLGFGAQSVEQALLDAGLTTEDFAGVVKDTDVNIVADEAGTEEDLHYDELYSLRYEEFIALNTHMIQKLLKRVATLEERLAQQETTETIETIEENANVEQEEIEEVEEVEEVEEITTGGEDSTAIN